VAQAGDITYNIVDYPANQFNGYSTDTISGTIITDGMIGPLTAANLIGGAFLLNDGQGNSIAGPATFRGPIDLEATATQLLLDLNADSFFAIFATQPDSSWSATVAYSNFPGDGQYDGGFVSNPPLNLISSYFVSCPVPTTPGSIGANTDWVIATVPEPSTLALLVVVGIVFIWRQKRLQFTVRTLLIVMTCCVVIAAIVKCETDARTDFAAKVAIVDAALGKVLTEADQELYDQWGQNARVAKPPFGTWETLTRSWKDKVKVTVYPNGSGEAQVLGHFGSSHDWTIIRSPDSRNTDYSRQPITEPNQVTHIDVTVTCSRPCSLLSRTTSVTIESHPAPGNKLLIDRLRAELDKNGIKYRIVGYP